LGECIRWVCIPERLGSFHLAVVVLFVCWRLLHCWWARFSIVRFLYLSILSKPVFLWVLPLHPRLVLCLEWIPCDNLHLQVC
jgi:hypothetical protein